MKYNPQIHHRRSIRLKGYDYSKAGAYFITICCENMKHRFGNVENDEMILNEFGKIAFDEWLKLPGRFLNFELDVFQIMPNHMHSIIVLNDSVGATLAVAHESDTLNSDDRAGASPAPTIDCESDTLNSDDRAGASPAPTYICETLPLNSDDRAGASPAPTIACESDTLDSDDRAGASPAPTYICKTHPLNSAGVTARVAPTKKPIGDIVGAYKSLVSNGCLEIFELNNITMGKLWQRNYFEHIIRNEKSYQKISEYILTNPQNWKEDKFFCE